MVVMYGTGGEIPQRIPDFEIKPLTLPDFSELQRAVVALPHGVVSLHVAKGLASLLPLLREKLKADGASLTPDQAAALVWLEGVAAGAGGP